MNGKKTIGILGGMGRPTRLAPCGDPDDLICSGQMNCPCGKVLAPGQNAWAAPNGADVSSICTWRSL